MEIIGFQIDKPFIRAALIQKGRNGFKICALNAAKLADPHHVKQLYSPKAARRQVSGLSLQHLMVRPLELNIGKSRHIEAALRFQSEAMTQLDAGEIISVPHSITKKDGKVNALLFSASRAAIRSQLEEFEKLQIHLDGLSCHGLSLMSYIKWKVPALSDCFIVDIGFSECSCVLMENGELKKSHSMNFGIEELFTALSEDRKTIPLSKEIGAFPKQMDLLEMDSGKLPHLFLKLSEMRQELGKILFSFHRLSNQKPIVFTGQVDAFKHLKEFLIENVRDAVTEELDCQDPEEGKFAIPVGLALEQAKKPLQLLREEFFPKKNWRQAGSYALSLMALSIASSLFFLFFALHQIHMGKEARIASVQKIIEPWDPKLKASLLKNEERTLDRWMATVATYSKAYPYILDVPRVSEVLSWLCQHPLLQEFQQENDLFELGELQYQLVEYPKIGSSKNRYRAKVNLQFKLKNLIHAKRFHETLKEDEFVDSSQEIDWETFDDNHYRLSFYPGKKLYVP